MAEKKDVVRFADEDDLAIELSSLVKQLEGVKVESEAEYVQAGNFLVATHATVKGVEEFFGEDLKAAQVKKAEAEAERKAVDTKIKKWTDPLTKAKAICQSRMSDFKVAQEVQRRKIEAEQQALEQKNAISSTFLVSGTIDTTVKAAPKIAGLREVEVWTVRVVDVAKVPLEYLTFNQAKAEKDAATLKDLFNVPGLEAHKTTNMVPTGR